jgi:CRISPR-associated endoribonuclease Cas6
MLIAIVLTLESDTPAMLPAYVGRANYAASLALLGRMDPALGGLIHDGDGPKPLVCSTILNARPHRDGVEIRPGQPYFVRVCGLTPAVSQALAVGLLTSDRPATWELDRHPFRLTAATADPAVDAWAGQSSYESLAAHQMLQSGQPGNTVTLDFASPTAFKSGGMQVPIPLPDLVFGSLVERWNTFSPVVLSPEVRRFGAEMVAISRYRLESKPVAQKNGALRIGGQGQVSYRAMSSDRYWLATLQMLADFALFSGVGVQTATGMGQVRRMTG